ncbi:MAG TPA: DCC1-like thiol-disulfide oxidoreductase family protein [Anaerolineales bacterium]|nr:DCC1-like thiol-disulfide oxidoreductase family protein [Anaerolineales bacterium]
MFRKLTSVLDLKDKCTDFFGADLRSLAALRVSMAVLIIVDLLRRSQDLTAHYTDFGVLPRTELLQDSSRWRISLHLANGTWEFQALLFVIAGILALALFVGYRTRLATIGSWFLLASLHSRNPVILDGGDVLLRVILFWGMFLPWGTYWSVDRALNSREIALPRRTLSAATFAYVSQIVLMYWFSAMLKTGVEWLPEGTAIYYALQFDQMVTPFAQYLLSFPSLLSTLTYSVYWFEFFGPLLLFSPVLTGPIRTFAILCFFLLHFGIGICLNIGIFTWVAPLAMLGLLPSWFWDKMILQTGTVPKIHIYYDGDCSRCFTSVRLLQTFLLLRGAVVSPAQGEASIKDDMRAHNSWVVIDHQGTRHFKFHAILALAEQSSWMWPLVPLLKMPSLCRIGNGVYRFLAIRRGKACPVNEVPAHTAIEPVSVGAFMNIIVLLLFAYVIFWNLTTVPNTRFKLSERSRSVGEILRLDQVWNMFAPYPPKYDGWYVISGRLKSGEIVDVFRDGEDLNWGKPSSVAGLFPSYRWWKYLFTTWNKGPGNAWLDYASYLCRSWKGGHGQAKALEELQIIYVLEATLPNYQIGQHQRIPLFDHRCETPR